uniref:Ranatuerin-2SEb n=1 Tax=Lithobates sevosus TaxID=299683 RepID=RN2B_LITSE|nr:RecName: Full=Ranatuerin-2SEb [Lithobates sevosus]
AIMDTIKDTAKTVAVGLLNKLKCKITGC